MGLLVSLLVLIVSCWSCSVLASQTCGVTMKMCICSPKTNDSLETVDCSSQKLSDVPTGIPANTKNPWDCTCASIIYLAEWLKNNAGLDSGSACNTQTTAVKDVNIELIRHTPCNHSHPTTERAATINPTTTSMITGTTTVVDNVIGEHVMNTDVCKIPLVSHICLFFCNIISACSLCFIIKPLRRY
uniref:Variable lymphocyte receptor C n=1 Tax=Mordacia mordax TaxID=7755 RepID=A0A8K1T079_MORMR|nr:variable lymphocyte receptor C [Mordacia mordax]